MSKRDLSFDELRRANSAKQRQWRDDRHYEEGDEWSLNDWFTAMAGEVGEAGNILKKIRRGDFTIHDQMLVKGESVEVHDALAHELADVMIYLDLLAMHAGIDLGEATREKFNIVAERHGIREAL